MLIEDLNNEKELLLSVAEGNEQAYEVLFNRYVDKLYTQALYFTKSPDLAKDICQEVFIKVWGYREKLALVDNMEAWLATVSKNYIRNVIKRKVLPVDNEEYLMAYMQDKQPNSQELMEWKERESNIYEIIGRLPPQMQQAFRLSRFDGLTHEEIAKKMNISRITSQNYIARALVILRKYLREHGDELRLVLLIFIF